MEVGRWRGVGGWLALVHQLKGALADVECNISRGAQLCMKRVQRFQDGETAASLCWTDFIKKSTAGVPVILPPVKTAS